MVSLIVVLTMAVLSAINKFLGAIKDKTATMIDNKIFDKINQLMSVLKIVSDWTVGNSHVEAKTAEAVVDGPKAGDSQA